MVDEYVLNTIRCFGQSVEVLEPNSSVGVKTKAFIQPLRYKDKMYMGGIYIEPGFLDGSGYLYIGASDVRLDTMPFNSLIKTKECNYVIRKARAVYFQEEILYIWAILQLCIEEEQ